MVDGGRGAGGRDGVLKLMRFHRQRFDPIVSGQGTVAPRFPTACAFWAALS
jgi:hypothetical protein